MGVYPGRFFHFVLPTITQFAPEWSQRLISYHLAPVAGSHSRHSEQPHCTPSIVQTDCHFLISAYHVPPEESLATLIDTTAGREPVAAALD